MGRPRKSASDGAAAAVGAAALVASDDLHGASAGRAQGGAAGGAGVSRSAGGAAAAAGLSLPFLLAGAGGGGKAAGCGSGGAAGSKRKPEMLLEGPGSRKAAKVGGGGGAEPAILTDRDGVPTTDSLRAWATFKLQALSDLCSTSFEQKGVKALQEGVNGVHGLAKGHYSRVCGMLEESSSAMDMARSQHEQVLQDLAAKQEQVLSAVEKARAGLLYSLQADILRPVEARVAALKARTGGASGRE